MRRLILIATGAASLAALGGCATSDRDYAQGYGPRGQYKTACERDYERNRAAATAAGAVLGGAAGAAVAKNDTAGAAIGAIAGGVIGRSLATKDDPCGYGFNGYYRDGDRSYGYWDDRRGRWVYG
jgi:hypothetical protein